MKSNGSILGNALLVILNRIVEAIARDILDPVILDIFSSLLKFIRDDNKIKVYRWNNVKSCSKRE
jgi:hypothetical protein